jgi:hypothetical protein
MRIGWVPLLIFAGPCHAAPPITSNDFDTFHRLIKPKASETSWARVPWLISLWEARVRAAAEGKPILLWELYGHPLGCT